MDMLDYCKTYSMVKSSYTNQESTEPNLQDAGRRTAAQQKHDSNEDCVVETIQSLSTTPADNLSLYNSVTQTQKELYQVGEDQLIPLKALGRNRKIASSMNARTHQRASFDSELTFAPKLNALSIKLAKERGEKMAERRNTASSVGAESDFTFKPKVSSNSVKIMQQLKTTFMDRQQMHVEKQKRYIEATINSYHTRGKLSPVTPVKSPTRFKKVSNIKEAPFNREVTLNEGQQLLPGNVTLQELFESMSAPDLLPTLNSVVKQSVDDPAATNSSSSCNVTDSLNQSNSEHNLTSSSSSDLTKKTSLVTMTNESSNSEHNLTSSSSTNLTKKLSKVKFAENVHSKSNEACKKMLETSPYNQSTENLYLRKHVIKRSVVKGRKRSLTHPLQKSGNNEKNESSWDGNTKIEDSKKSKVSHARSQSQPLGYTSQPAGKLKYEDPLFDKVRQAKCVAEAAIKQKRVFICHGPYPIVRATLRKRGWVEKHYRGHLLTLKNKKNDSDDSGDDSCDSDNDSDNQSSNSSNQSPQSKETNSKVSDRKPATNKTRKLSVTGSKVCKNKDKDDSGSDDDSDKNFDEEDWNAGYEGKGADFEFSLMSRCVRNSAASFIWTTKRDDVDFKFLRKDQIVNHYCKAYSFTTKIGLSTNLRNLKWYEEADHLTFFPRSHLLGSDEEKLDFIDDYRLTAAISIVKWVTERYANGCPSDEEPSHSQTKEEPPSSDQSQDRPKTESSNSPPSAKSRAGASRRSSNVVPLKALTLALEACQEYLRCREHLDIDEDANKGQVLTEDSWNLLVEYYYQVKMHGAVIASAYPYLKECQNTLKQMRDHLPQLEIDGTKNIWIVKPGAKSRGRGIMCMDRLDDILKLVGTTIGKKEGRLVVQKYIERPLLIHGVKFDIRQWFLVTDWNPLTMWFYQDCYLRFCTQIFSLDDFHISIHLANNSIQKHFENNGMRDKRLPDENMWSSDSFKEYLKKRGVGHMWDEVIYPGMKKAVIYALQSCQEIVEYRKSSFELYGADFIISEDYKPWLLEINCSPTMGPSTAVTKKLCAQVLEDTLKVVLDRREDKNCDTGRYELAFKQPQVTAPPYIGINMAVEGQAIRKAPVQVKRQHDVTSEAPRVTAPSYRSKDAPSENIAAKIAALARPKETRNALVNCSDTLEYNGSKRQSESKGKSNTRKPEGSWAMGCLCAAQPIPVATTFCTTDDGKLKGLIARARRGYSPEVDVSTDLQQRGQRQMKIPTAVLKYSSNASLRTDSQLPISIGPDNNVKHF